MKTRNSLTYVLVAATVIVSAATALNAAGSHDPEKSGMDHGGMSGMMGGGGMMDMMRGMGRMMGMMDSCPMMRRNSDADGDTGRPNSQWRQKPPASQEKGG